MHHFDTLNFNGLNMMCNAPPVLLSDFELATEEFEDEDMTSVLEFVDENNGKVVSETEDGRGRVREKRLSKSMPPAFDRERPGKERRASLDGGGMRGDLQGVPPV
jgi:hypothetical protein